MDSYEKTRCNSSKFEKLSSSKELSDIKFTVDDKCLYALHKNAFTNEFIVRCFNDKLYGFRLRRGFIIFIQNVLVNAWR